MLLALSWLLEVYAVARVEPPAATRPVVVAVVVSLGITVVMVRALGRERGSLAAASLVVVLIVGRNLAATVAVVAAIVVLMIERRWSSQRRISLPWPRIHEALAILVTVLFVVQLGRVATRADPPPEVSPGAWDEQPLNDASRPDIFVLLADAHGRQDVLRDAYGYDDTPFITGLEADGFEVASSSSANYYYTEYSLASMFTSSYLATLNDDPEPAFQNALARHTIEANPAFPLLRRAGYEITVISSGYEHLGLRSADQFVDTGQPNEFELVLIHNVAVTSLWDDIDPQHGYGGHSRQNAR